MAPVLRHDSLQRSGHDYEANAHLIAAAPELLEALKALALWRDTKGSIMLLAEVIEQARVVIAKAEGRA